MRRLVEDLIEEKISYYTAGDCFGESDFERKVWEKFNLRLDAAALAATARKEFRSAPPASGFDREEAIERLREICDSLVYAEINRQFESAVEAARDVRDAERRLAYLTVEAAVSAASNAVQKALRGRAEHHAARSGSHYFTYRGLALRVADHSQVKGGGWCPDSGERHGESDYSWVVTEDSDVPSREEIRRKVARLLRTKSA